MKVYHEIDPDALEAALVNGLSRTSRGEKGDDSAIIRTDQFLDARCPLELKDQGVSRDDNLYAYIRVDDTIVDITDGDLVPLAEFIENNPWGLLELDVDPQRCFVSDLDTYDALKAGLETRRSQHILDQLVSSYWKKVVRLSAFQPVTIRRPEVMIPYDVPPTAIRSI